MTQIREQEASRRILDARAAKLATPAATPLKGDTFEVVTFRLGAETCAIDASIVISVFRLSRFARLPGATAPLHAVTMWRGEVLTLLDLRTLLGISTTALTDLGRVIVVGSNKPAFGFLADSVTEIRALARGDVCASDAESANRSIVSGITPDAVLVLDSGRVLDLGKGD